MTTQNDLECVMLSEISQTEKVKYHIIYLHVKYKQKKKTTKNHMLTHKYRHQSGSCQKGGIGGLLAEKGEVD